MNKSLKLIFLIAGEKCLCAYIINNFYEMLIKLELKIEFLSHKIID